MRASAAPDEPGEWEYIYVTRFYHKGLRKYLVAKDYGKRAFRLRIRRPKK